MPPKFTKSVSDVQYIYQISNIYIGRPIYISDILYLYPTSGYLYPTSGYLYPTSYIYIGRPISISDADIPYPTSARVRARARAKARARARAVYQMSDIDIGRPIYILDVRYRFRKHWLHFVLNSPSYARFARSPIICMEVRMP